MGHETGNSRRRGNSTGVRITDIAERCSLSVMTVSRAIRDAYGVSPRTREKVMAVARELGYVRNQLASNLVQQRTQTIGVVIPEFDHCIFPSLVEGIEGVLNPERYRIFLCCSHDDAEKEAREVQALLERRVDGIILAPSSMASSRETIHWIQSQRVPLVLVDRIVPGVTTDTVTVDDYNGARLVMRHLIEQGFRSIAHIAGPQDIWTCMERLRGYRDALAEAGIEVDQQRIVHTGLTVAAGVEAMGEILGWGSQPDAVFCVNDPVAIGAFKVLQRRGVAVPGQMALAGFSDIMECEIMQVPLTTVSQKPGQLGKHAAQLLLSRIAEGAPRQEGARSHVVETSLVVRESTIKQGARESELATA